MRFKEADIAQLSTYNRYKPRKATQRHAHNGQHKFHPDLRSV